jgi:hypothetical protein
MAHRFSLLRLAWRLSVLAILSASLTYLWADSKALADLNTTCYQCDSNNVTTLSNCSATLDSCLQDCQNNHPNDPFCPDHCYTNYDTCTTNSWNTYDNCLYGFTDNSGLCAITGSGGTPPPSGKGRTPCDNACKANLLDCMQNNGTTCGADYNECSLSCG